MVTTKGFIRFGKLISAKPNKNIFIGTYEQHSFVNFLYKASKQFLFFCDLSAIRVAFQKRAPFLKKFLGLVKKNKGQACESPNLVELITWQSWSVLKILEMASFQFGRFIRTSKV